MKKMVKVVAMVMVLVLTAGIMFACSASKLKGTYYSKEQGVYLEFDGKGSGKMHYEYYGDMEFEFSYRISGDKLTLTTYDPNNPKQKSTSIVNITFTNDGFVMEEKGVKTSFVKQ